MSDTFRDRRMATFIVRLSWANTGDLSGVVERVATGEKWRFRDAKSLGRVIESFVRPARHERRKP